MWHGGGLLGGGRGAQAGVLAAYVGEVHQVVVAGFLWLVFGCQEGGRETHDPGRTDVPALVLPLMGGHLTGGGKSEAAARADAVEVVGGLAVDATFVLALLVLVELLEAILGVGIILNVVALVLLDVTLVFERECAARTPGNEKEIMSSSLQRHLTAPLLSVGVHPWPSGETPD